jgi:hypothetical protein
VKQIKSLLVVLFLFLAAANALTVDFMPVQAGNTWVFLYTVKKGKIYDTLYRKVTITKTGPTSGTTTLFDVVVYDSGAWGSLNDSFYSPVVKSKDSISFLADTIYMNLRLRQFFPLSMRDTVSWISGQSYDKYFPHDDSIVFQQVRPMPIFFGTGYYSSDSLIAISNIGPVYSEHVSATGETPLSYEFIQLLSFNGTSVSIPDIQRLESKAAQKPGCGYGTGTGLAFIPAVGFKLRFWIKKKKAKDKKI